MFGYMIISDTNFHLRSRRIIKHPIQQPRDSFVRLLRNVPRPVRVVDRPPRHTLLHPLEQVAQRRPVRRVDREALGHQRPEIGVQAFVTVTGWLSHDLGGIGRHRPRADAAVLGDFELGVGDVFVEEEGLARHDV